MAARGRAPPLPIAAEGDEDPFADAAAAAAAAVDAAQDREIYGPNRNHQDVSRELDPIQQDAVYTKFLLKSKRVERNEYYRYLVTPPQLLGRGHRIGEAVRELWQTLPANARTRRHLLSLMLTGEETSVKAASLRDEIDENIETIRDAPTQIQHLNKGRSLVKVKPYLLRQPVLLPKPDIDKNKKRRK